MRATRSSLRSPRGSKGPQAQAVKKSPPRHGNLASLPGFFVVIDYGGRIILLSPKNPGLSLGADPLRFSQTPPTKSAVSDC
jgi:hypothetical protein